MAIVKRLNATEKLNARLGDNWRSIIAYPMVAALCNPSFIHHVDATPEGIAKMTSAMYDRSWISSVDWHTKIFLYTAGMVARRANTPGFLPDDKLTELGRHMNAQTTIDKIDKGDVCGLTFRMCFIFDLPAFRERYTANGSLALPNPLSAASGAKKRQRKRLKKHRKQ